MKLWEGQTGLTLVEMLVALMLVGLIASLSVTLLPAMKRAATRSEEFQHNTTELGRSHDFLRTLIENAVAMDDLGALQAAIAPLTLQPGRLELLTRLPEGLGNGGLQRVSLSVEGSEGHRVLKLAVLPLRAGSPAGSEGAIIEDATEIAWSYFDRRAGTWSDHGPLDESLPDLIRLSVETKQTGRWPSLVAAPQLEGGALCVFDVLAKACRKARP